MLAFDSDREGTRDIYLRNPSVEEDDRLFDMTSGPATDQNPAWSPDGAYLLFESNRGGVPGIYSVGENDDTDVKLLVEGGTAPNWGNSPYSGETQLGDSTLQVGESFTDPEAGITVTVTRE